LVFKVTVSFFDKLWEAFSAPHRYKPADFDQHEASDGESDSRSESDARSESQSNLSMSHSSDSVPNGDNTSNAAASNDDVSVWGVDQVRRFLEPLLEFPSTHNASQSSNDSLRDFHLRLRDGKLDLVDDSGRRVLKHLRASDIEPLLKMLVESGELELVIDRSRHAFVASPRWMTTADVKRLDYYAYEEIMWAYGQQPTEEGFAKLSSSIS
jgi:hypothetical protein